MSNKKYLFVCGVARSGTTALAEILNYNPNIVLGIERYKFRFIGSRSPLPDDPSKLFDEDRFFSFDKEDTNILIDSGKYREVYSKAKKRYQDATYVGDKIPGLYKRLPFLKKNFSSCKVIYIVRNPILVAESWQTRADNPNDSWAAENGFKKSIEEWNRSLQIVYDAFEKWGENLILVDYSKIFGENAIERYPSLLLKLGLSAELQPEEVEFLKKSAEIATSARNHNAEIVEYVTNNADMELYERLQTFAT